MPDQAANDHHQFSLKSHPTPKMLLVRTLRAGRNPDYNENANRSRLTYCSQSMKKYPGSIYRREGSKRLYIEYRGEKISTHLPDTKENRKIAEQMLWTLWRREQGLEVLSQSDRVVRALTTPDEAWDEYEVYLHAADRSEKTIQAYRDAYRKMRPEKFSMESIEQGVQRFIRSWEGKPSSINIHLRNYEAFLHWCHKKKYVTEYPDLKGYRRRGVEKEVQILTRDEVGAVLSYLHENGDRDLAHLVELMYHTGLRVGEAMKLHVSQILNVDGIKVIKIANKVNRKPDYIPLTSAVVRILNARGSIAQVFPWQPSTVSKLTRRFNLALNKVGITDRSGFHILRKSFRHRLQVAGVAVDAAKRLMRHSNIRTTDEHYTLYETSSLAKVLDSVLENEQEA